MIIFFNNKIKLLSEKNLNSNLIQDLMPKFEDIKDNKCPCCKQKNALIKYGHYSRYVSIATENEIQTFRVSVQRVICTSCNKTHALLPSFIVPYVTMAICSITKIVANSAKTSAYQVSNLLNISYQIIQKYIAMVIAFFKDYHILNNKNKYIEINKFNQKYYITNCERLSEEKYLIDFFEFHTWLLYMQKFRNNSSPKIHIFCIKMSPT